MIDDYVDDDLRMTAQDSGEPDLTLELKATIARWQTLIGSVMNLSKHDR